MGNKLYVGNLPYSVRDEDLNEAFSAFGNVVHAKVMMERESGRSKGFGFVEMSNDAQAQAAISGMSGRPMGGRNLVVNEARPMEPRPPRSGGFGGGAGRGGPAGGGYGSPRREGTGFPGGQGDGGFRSPYGAGPRHGGGNRNGGTGY